MRLLRLSAAVISFLCVTLQATFANEMVVIVNPGNAQALQLDDVARIYLGKQNRFPDGRAAVPLDLNPEDPQYKRFAKIVLKKTPSQLRAYWAKRIFTGKGAPPRRVKNQRQVRELVARESSHLGYVERSEVDNSVHSAITIDNPQ